MNFIALVTKTYYVDDGMKSSLLGICRTGWVFGGYKTVN